MEEDGPGGKLAEIYRLKQELDKEMPSVISTGDTTKALKLKAEIERRISAVQELLTPPGTFNKEQREALEGRGYVIVRLTGQSIASERDRGNKFRSTWHKDYPDFENKTSRLTEVAFNPEPDKFFLPWSNNMTLEQQQDMVDEYSQTLQQELKAKGITAIIGETPDYIELAFGYMGNHHPLFGKEYNFRYTRTQTYIESNVANVGHFNPDDGLHVSHWNADNGHSNLWVAPLVVSSGN